MLNKRLRKAPMPVTSLKHLALTGAFAFLAAALLLSAACGKRKPPLPPVERVAQRIELSGFQRGSHVLLSWKMPARNASTGSVLNIDRADIYRLAEPSNARDSISEDEFASRSVLIAALKITDSDFGLKTISYTDELEFAGQPAQLRYAVRFVNAAGQKAGFSNFLLIEPAANIAASPTGLMADVTQEAINLSWKAPEANVDGSKPVNLVGYNIYRSPSEKEPAKLLNKAPVTSANFADEFFEFEKDYFYFVRAVSVGSDAVPTESLESNIVKIHAVDTFAPGAPEAITLAASPSSISLFFAVNPEKDIAGYRIYRSLDPEADKSTWGRLTPDLLTTNTFQDIHVESGKTYFYYLTATDKAGNVSSPSAVVSETVP
jgi:hypothetical protein